MVRLPMCFTLLFDPYASIGIRSIMSAVKSEAADSHREKDQKGMTSADADHIGRECLFSLPVLSLAASCFIIVFLTSYLD